MPAQEPTHPRSIPIILATASVTVALGITLAGLTGYLRPPQPESVPRESESTPRPSTPASTQDGPAVVLVPVSETNAPGDAQTVVDAPVAGDTDLVAYAHEEREEDDQHEHRTGHHERELDDDDD